MSIDFTQGRYMVVSADGGTVGHIDGDEYIRQGKSIVYRLDGDEVYNADGKLVATVEGNTARTPASQVLFVILAE